MQHKENLLCPLVVLRVAGAELSAPIKVEAKPYHLPLHVLDVAAGPLVGGDAALHGGVLSRQAE